MRLREADIIVLIRQRTSISKQLIDNAAASAPNSLSTGPNSDHIDVAACTERRIAVVAGNKTPVATAELTWALSWLPAAACHNTLPTQPRRVAAIGPQ